MTDPHELPRQPIELGDEISNARFLTGRKTMIDITKPVWTKRGGVVDGVSKGPSLLSGIENLNGSEQGYYWKLDGTINGDHPQKWMDEMQLTNTPPATVAPIPCPECERKQAQITHLEKEVSRLHVANRALSKMGTERGAGR